MVTGHYKVIKQKINAEESSQNTSVWGLWSLTQITQLVESLEVITPNLRAILAKDR